VSDAGLIVRGLRDRITRARRIFARATAWPFAVRLGVFAAAITAQGFAYPPEGFLGAGAVGMLALAGLPAVWPRSAAVSVFWLVTAAGWVFSSTVFDSVATLPRLVGVAVSLYVVHSGAALAAALPYDAVVDGVVVARWALRAFAVTVVAVGVSVAGMFAVTGLADRTYLAATLVGLLPAVGLVWLLVVVSRRR
jgi:hypothetical protein